MLKKIKRRIKAIIKRIALSSALRPLSMGYFSKHINVRGMESGKMLTLDEATNEAILAFAPDDFNNKDLRRDIMKCYFINGGITPEDYFIFEFKNKTPLERSEFISRDDKDRLYIRSVGTGEKYRLLHDKYVFYNAFKPYFKREVCHLTAAETEDFVNFCKHHSEYIAKRESGRGGFGTVVRKCNGDDAAIREELAFLLKNGSEWVVEEVLHQDARMAVLNPSSVNTIRISSFIRNGTVGILDAYVRCGREGSVVDNACSGGIAACVDAQTGVVCSAGADKRNHYYTSHPDNHTEFIGMQIPRWEELLALTEEVHKKIPFYPLVGWDFVLTDSGWVLIEANWGNPLSQIVLKKGARKQFEACFQE